jgi:hypothetical protein
MQLHLLLTQEIYQTKPETCKIVADFGELKVIFTDRIESGLHCFVEDNEENIINWLKPFNSVVVGSGNPMIEEFEIMHIK